MAQKDCDYANDYFYFNRRMLICAGLWTPNFGNKFFLYLYKIYALLAFMFIYIWYTMTEFISLKDTCKELEPFIKNINFVFTHLLGTFKCFLWYFKGDQLRDIMNVLESDEFHYECDEEFTPGLIMQKYKQTGFRYSLSFFVLGYLTIGSSYIPLYINTLMNSFYYEDENGNVISSQPLPYYSWIPFSYDTPKRYFLILVYQSTLVLHYVFIIIGMDTLFMNIMNFITAHLVIIHGAFKTNRTRCMKRINGPLLNNDNLHNSHALEVEMMMEMKKIIRHLQTVIKVCEKLEDLHKYLTLSQVLATLFIFCTSLFLISTTPVHSTKFISECIYMIAMGFQLILYCFFGNEVTLRGLEIPNALWESDWLESSYSYKRCIMLTMLRMQRPLYLTAGKFAPLTLTTFVAIIKASYSFYAVLQKVND